MAAREWRRHTEYVVLLMLPTAKHPGLRLVDVGCTPASSGVVGAGGTESSPTDVASITEAATLILALLPVRESMTVQAEDWMGPSALGQPKAARIVHPLAISTGGPVGQPRSCPPTPNPSYRSLLAGR